MSYISSNDNRFYVGLEASYGQTPSVSAANRIPAVKLTTQYKAQAAQPRDKTGTRTFQGDPSQLRSSASFELKTYLTNWSNTSQAPPYGHLFQAALGGAPMLWSGGQ